MHTTPLSPDCLFTGLAHAIVEIVLPDGRTVENALGPTAGIDAFSDLSDILASLNHAEEADTARLMGERAQIAADAEKAVKAAREAVARVFDLPPTDEMRLGSALALEEPLWTTTWQKPRVNPCDGALALIEAAMGRIRSKYTRGAPPLERGRKGRPPEKQDPLGLFIAVAVDVILIVWAIAPENQHRMNKRQTPEALHVAKLVYDAVIAALYPDTSRRARASIRRTLSARASKARKSPEHREAVERIRKAVESDALMIRLGLYDPEKLAFPRRMTPEEIKAAMAAPVG